MWLKLLACMLMLIDHIAHFFAPALSPGLYFFMRMVGRLAFPCFAYLIVLGMKRSRDIKRYFCRLLLMAIMTQALFFLAERWFGFTLYVNVLFTFSFGLLCLVGLELLLFAWPDVALLMRPAPAQGLPIPTGDLSPQRVSLYGLTMKRRTALILGLGFLLAGVALTAVLEPDYDYYGLFTMMIFYFCEMQRQNALDRRKAKPPKSPQSTYRWMFFCFALLNLLDAADRLSAGSSPSWALLQSFSIFALPFFPLAFVGQKPGRVTQYAFYLFYPLHIFLLVALRALILPLP